MNGLPASRIRNCTHAWNRRRGGLLLVLSQPLTKGTGMTMRLAMPVAFVIGALVCVPAAPVPRAAADPCAECDTPNVQFFKLYRLHLFCLGLLDPHQRGVAQLLDSRLNGKNRR